MTGVNEIQLPDELIASLLDFSKYPLPVATNSSYDPALITLRQRLNRKKAKLFTQDSNDVVIPVREIVNTDGQFKVTKRNLLTETKVKEWIGDTYEPDPNDPAKFHGALATKPDATCRFILLISHCALAPLELTRDALLRILAYHQVMPNYIDFLLVYGAQEEDRELRYGGFRTRTTLSNPHPGHVVPGLHRSGCQHEMCFNLKAVSQKEENPKDPFAPRWRIEQSAIYHRFHLKTGTALWIIGDPREAVKGMVGDVLPEGSLPRNFRFGTVVEAFISSLDIHLLLAQWASDEWRSHIQSLEATIERLTRPALVIDTRHEWAPRVQPRAMTYVHENEEKVNETVMVIKSNVKILTSLASFYQTLVNDPDFPNTQVDVCKSAVKRFTAGIDQLIQDLQTQVTRAEALLQITNGPKAIIIQQLQIQSAYQQEMLSNNMMGFSERGQKETIMMRIITIITLLYLPPTFVPTFFSTDVIKYQDDGEDKVHFSNGAMSSFLYVTLPLATVTVVLAVGYYRFEIRRIEKASALKRGVEAGGV
ncbi:hypothetical protein QBC37DRAFT_324857 [Rhypophila decipiens]|uniref:CorA-like transporter domain-containing protein n=1 Tax=Rhypophila decipiens TaxID=261697 RepID=A0AAN6Y098_9PEZI|nr:hypothetical protein QBC37DRAFT_324857 [Rhypophila decipiens]